MSMLEQKYPKTTDPAEVLARWLEAPDNDERSFLASDYADLMSQGVRCAWMSSDDGETHTDVLALSDCWIKSGYGQQSFELPSRSWMLGYLRTGK